MIIDRYDPNEPVGKHFRRIMKMGKDAITAKNDDFILVIGATAGKGKSSLGLWTYEDLDPNATVDQVALTRSDFAIGIDEAAKKEGFRYFQYDEGKMNRRDWQSDWSKELLELYHDCRGDNIFHVWCTAMPELLDRVFVEERVKGFAFIYSKGTLFRRFLYFTKADLLRFMEANDNKLSCKLLDKYGKTFASLDSYFIKYNGKLWADYEAKKNSRLSERRTAFREKWASDGWRTAKEVQGILGIAGNTTVPTWTRKLVEAGIMTEGDDFAITATAQYRFHQKGIDKLKDYSQELRNRSIVGNPLGKSGSNEPFISLFTARSRKKKADEPNLGNRRPYEPISVPGDAV